MGLAPSGPDRAAGGPPAVAISATGEVFVLDARNSRIVASDMLGQRRVFADDIVIDAEDLTVSSHGLAVHSPLRGHAWIFAADGAPVGDVAIPRSFRHVAGIELLPSRQLAIRSALQERYTVGSPAAPRDLATQLASRREGAFAVADRGVMTIAEAGRVDLAVMREATPGSRARISHRVPMPGPADAAQLFGTHGEIACARVEEVDRSTETVRVARRALCIDTGTGAVVFDRALPDRGVYLPRHELAVGGPVDVPTVAFAHAQTSGLHVTACEVHL